MESTVRELAGLGRHDLLDALRSGNVSLPDLHSAKLNGRLDELLDDREDPPLEQAVDSFLSAHDDPRYRTGMDRLKEIAPDGTRASWITDPTNWAKLVTHYRKEKLSADCERRELIGVLLFVKQFFGAEARQRLKNRIRLRPASEGRTEYATPGQIAKIEEVAGEWWLPIRLTISTGLRRGELLRLRVKDLLLDSQKLVVRRGKSRHARRDLPLDDEMIAMLRGWIAAERLEADDRVFSLNRHELRWAWDTIRDEAEVPHLRWHDLRHTYAVYCAMSGMPLTELRQRLGVGSLGLVQRYAAYAPDATTHHEAALGRMGLGGSEKVPTVVPTVEEEKENAGSAKSRKPAS